MSATEEMSAIERFHCNTFLDGVIFWGVQVEGAKFSSSKNFSICNDHCVFDIFRIGGKML